MAGSWYLFDGARQLGPLSLSELKHFLEVKSLPDVQVWREGLKEWAAPSDLPEFAPVGPPPIPTISEDGPGQGADDDVATKPHRFNNFIARNWRGEFSLGTTYWLFGFLGNLFAGVLAIAVMAAFQSDGGYEPRAIFATILLVWVGIVTIALWQRVGVWRSADRHIKARVLRGFKYGLTDDFVKILNASRQIKVVHLDSLGGRIGEAEKLNKVIRSKNLDT